MPSWRPRSSTSPSPMRGGPTATGWRRSGRRRCELRDLLKFDFYFADSSAFREHIAEEMSWLDDWEHNVAAGGEHITAMLRAKRPLIAGAMLRPFGRGLRDRRRRAEGRTSRDQREGPDSSRARRGSPIRCAGPGAQQRSGVRAAVHPPPVRWPPTSICWNPRRTSPTARGLRRRTALHSARHGRGRAHLASTVRPTRTGSTSGGRRPDGSHNAPPYAGAMTTVASRLATPVPPRCGRCWSGSDCWRPSPPRESPGCLSPTALTATGLPNPGPVTSYGLPFRAGPRARSLTSSRRSGRSSWRRSWCRRRPTASWTRRAIARCEWARFASGVWGGVRGAAGTAHGLRRHRAAADEQAQPVGHLVGGRPDRGRGTGGGRRCWRHRHGESAIPVLRWSLTRAGSPGALTPCSRSP